MRKFGYIEYDDGESEALYTEDGLSTIIRQIQRFGAIPETGVIDNATLKARILNLLLIKRYCNKIYM